MSQTFRRPMSMRNMMAAILGHVGLNAGIMSRCIPSAPANVIPEPNITRVQRPSGRKNNFKQGRSYRELYRNRIDVEAARARNGVGRPPKNKPAPYKSRA